MLSHSTGYLSHFHARRGVGAGVADVELGGWSEGHRAPVRPEFTPGARLMARDPYRRPVARRPPARPVMNNCPDLDLTLSNTD